MAYNFLKALRFKTPYEKIIFDWTVAPTAFHANSHHFLVGLTAYAKATAGRRKGSLGALGIDVVLKMNMPLKTSLPGHLPKARGALKENIPLRDMTWFRVGGPAEFLFTPTNEEDLAQFLGNLPTEIPVTVLGLASNVIVRDGGIRGVVIRPSALKNVTVDGHVITAGAGAVDAHVARTALAHNLTGLEFMSGIPGSIGGGLRMNAGAYGREFKDVLIDARAIDRRGNIHTLSNADFGFSYRHCNVPDDWIFTSARFQATSGDPVAIKARMDEIQNARSASQPIRERTGGSTFANPEGRKAWQLIDDAGCRGLKRGDAEVSTQHCNFLINRGQASADDIETLGETVRQKVAEKAGIQLRWEIKRLGQKA